ncbi:MAG: sugar ABC transporter permease [Beijerinckiaceae bacterium]|nr:sugar ABC transporter permease [Beijerinckiaceae bacterium]MCZ8298772.1 sugar ABC transporter permease [Beijerinckiaceae bacterium]
MPSRQGLNRATPYFFLAPAAAVALVGLVYPMLRSVWLSFHEWSIGTPPESARFVGLENYRWLVADDAFWVSVGVTLAFALAVVVLEVVLGVALALVLDRDLRGTSLFRTIFILPMMIAPIVVGLIWRFLYNEQFGPLSQALKALGLPGVPWLSSPDMALLSVIIADVWQWTPFIFILALAALQGLPASAIEAARIDGATRWQTTWYIKLPLIAPVIAVAALLRLIDAFKVLEVIYILTEGGPGLSTEILSLHIYKTAFVSQQLGRASALSNLLLLIVLVLTLLLVLARSLRESRAGKE